MAVTTFHDFPLAPRDREWDGAAAEKRVRAWADAQDKPTPRYRDAHIWYDVGSKQNFTAYNIMQGSRGGIDLPEPDITRVKNHLAKYYKKMGKTAPWERD